MGADSIGREQHLESEGPGLNSSLWAAYDCQIDSNRPLEPPSQNAGTSWLYSSFSQSIFMKYLQTALSGVEETIVTGNGCGFEVCDNLVQ